MKVLIVKLSSIGDVVHTLPALASLRKGLGKEARIDWLVEEAASGILKSNPLIDNVITVKRGWLKNFSHNLEKARFLSSERYDIVLDFQGLLKSGIWVYLSKGKRRIGFSNARELSHVFLNEKLPPFDIERHAVERYLDLAAYAGGAKGEVTFPLSVNEDAKAGVLSVLKEKGLSEGEPFFVIIARARWKTKLWSDEKFIELARKIAAKTGFKAVLAGGSEDKDGLDVMRGKIGDGAINLAGLTDLNALSALLSLSRFTVTVDSGPMHIAAALGVKVAAIFGPTAPWRTGPYGKGHIVLRNGVGCSPCFKKDCTDLKCMDGITPEDVLNALAPFMEKKA